MQRTSVHERSAGYDISGRSPKAFFLGFQCSEKPVGFHTYYVFLDKYIFDFDVQ